MQDKDTTWRYRLAVRGEAGGRNRPIVDDERVEKDGECVLSRPDAQDRKDPERLTQTHLEQISANHAFRGIATHLQRVQYFHLVPQIIRDPARMAPTQNDPYGSDFIAHMNGTPAITRSAWLRRMQEALRAAVPGFESLTIETDAAGKPHLIAGYKNWRSTPSRQNEADFSDGTLRLIGLLWSIIKAPANPGVLLPEEPELSLNSAIVRLLPTLLAQVRRSSDLQILLSTHAPELLNDEGISPDEVLVLTVTRDGSQATLLSSIPDALANLDLGLTKSEVIDGLIAPGDLGGAAQGHQDHQEPLMATTAPVSVAVEGDSDGECPVQLRERLVGSRSHGNGFELRLARSVARLAVVRDELLARSSR